MLREVIAVRKRRWVCNSGKFPALPPEILGGSSLSLADCFFASLNGRNFQDVEETPESVEIEPEPDTQ